MHVLSTFCLSSIAVLLAAAGGSPMKAKTSYFNDVEIADGELKIMDGGTHGVAGHTVVLKGDQVTWSRRTGSVRPSGKPGEGAFKPPPEELAQLRGFADTLWKRAETTPRDFFAPPDRGPPRWVWAIVQRRGKDVRVLEGGEMASPRAAPAEAVPAIEWMQKRLDALAAD